MMFQPSKQNSDPHRPTLLMIGRLYPPARSSGARLLRELSRSFARDGWDVRVLTTDTEGGVEPDGPVLVQRLAMKKIQPTLWRGLILLFRFLIAGLRGKRPDLIITLSDPPLLAVAGHWISKIRKVPHIHWCHDVYPDLLPVIGISCPKWIYNWMFRATRRAMNACARVVVVGRCMARYLGQSGVDSRRMTLIPNWPELAMNPHIRSGTVNTAAVDPALGEAPLASILEPVPKFRVLYVGTVGYAHPVDTILDAATILESLNPEIEFIFVCDQSAQDIVNAEKARRALGNVRVLPFQPLPRLRDIMESGDIHLISMKEEAAGLMVPAKFYAALAAARPCILIGPEACEIARVINDYSAGAVVPQKAAQMLAQVITDYRLREDLWFTAHNGAQRAATAYTAEDMIRLWLKKAREILAQPAA